MRLPTLSAPLRRLLILAWFALATGPARAAADTDKLAIAVRLTNWAQAFNARDTLCANLSSMLDDHTKAMSYGLQIREIVVSGDLGVVRLTWTLTTASGGVKTVSKEQGLDIFRRQPDGSW